MKLLFATGNDYKFNLMKERLKGFEDIELVNPKMLGINIEVEEDGKTAEENSINPPEPSPLSASVYKAFSASLI